MLHVQRKGITLVKALRIIIGLLAVYFAALGLMFLFAPARGAEIFALTPIGSQGLASLRADFSAFFLCWAIFAGYGAWSARPSPLLVPLTLFVIALLGRVIGLFADGIGPEAFFPMAVEAASIVVLVAGLRLFPARRRAGGDQ